MIDHIKTGLPEVVMKITGHTKRFTLQRYIKISDSVVEEK
jgi:hypothetical protein